MGGPTSQRTDPLGLIGRTIDGRYEVTRLVDEGGYGYVYAATRIMWDKPVALKLFKSKADDPDKLAEAKRAFIAEGAVLNELSRKTTAIVQSFDIGVVDCGEAGELLYMALEWLQGRTLKEVLDQEARGPDGEYSESPSPWSLERMIDTMQSVAVALAVAHGSGVAHRDIKPANIFLVEDDDSEATTKLLDFGVAKVVEDLQDGFDSTGSHDGPFTPKYAAPEQFTKRLGSTGPWSDVYALAVVCVELLAGHYPLDAQGFGSLIFTVTDPNIRPTPRYAGVEVDDDIEAVFAKALALETDERYRDAGEFWRALLEAAGISQSSFPVVDGRVRQPSLLDLEGVSLRPPPISGSASPSKAPPSEGPPSQSAAAKSGAPSRRAPDSSVGVTGEAFTIDAPPPSALASRGRFAIMAVALMALGGIITAVVLSTSDREASPSPAASATTAAPQATNIPRERVASFGALPKTLDDPDDPGTPARVALGSVLFFDARLSRHEDVSCANCHQLDKYGVDGERFSRGTGGVLGERNTPTVFNIAGASSFMWDGRADSLVEQVSLPMLSEKEHGMSAEEIETRLRAIDGYKPLFEAAFDDRPAVSFANVARAIAAFERTLLTPAPWDDYQEGGEAALSAAERAGFNAFVDAGCPTCHVGPYVGATMNQKLGLVHTWPESKDRGRFEHTDKDADMMVFRVPSLRNVAETAPYFHDGSVASLNEAVRLMAYHQLGKELDDDEIKAIVGWLRTLTGRLPRDRIRQPTLPASAPSP